MISPDTPIFKIEDDRLGRAPFALAIAKAIVNADCDDSFAIAINGKWGSGKSSILNLCVAEIRRLQVAQTGPIDILQFNPWNFADQNQLVIQFFRQFSGHLRKLERAGVRKVKDLVSAIDSYAVALAPPFEALPMGKVAVPILQLGLGAARKKLGLAQDLESMHDAIINQLVALNRKTVVVMDDLDRLTGGEIRQVFQLVKASARFPRVIYLLAFDKEYVCSALSELSVGSGAEYLEKIIQVSYDLPPVSESVLTKMIMDALNDILSRYPPAHFDDQRFQNLLFSGFRQSFESLRDVRRFLNGLEFAFGMISREINGVDFIGLECLRVFYPAIYAGVRGNKGIFAGCVDSATERKGAAAYREEFSRCFTGTQLSDEIRDLLMTLFPKLEYAFRSMAHGAQSEQRWEADLRVASSRYFDVYFQLNLPSDELSSVEMDTVVSSAGVSGALQEFLVSCIKSKRILNAVASLRHRLTEVPQQDLGVVLGALIAVGDSVKQRGAPLFGDIPEFWHVRWAIFDVLDRTVPQNRLSSLSTAFLNSTGVGTMADITAHLARFRQEKPEKYSEMTAEGMEGLQRIVVERIRASSTEAWFLDRESLPIILWAWKTWGGLGEVRKFVETLYENPGRMLAFVEKSKVKTYSSSVGEKAVAEHERLACAPLAEMLDLSRLRAYLTGVDAASLSPVQQGVREFAIQQLDELVKSGLTPEQFDERRRMDQI
jgi:hypothetical protein